ncbi:MAG TPA: hypothetical protein VFI53_09030 [Myxococcaceae bacterium]|nr:hypothetical protein [Myxococcaceae bacterium]
MTALFLVTALIATHDGGAPPPSRDPAARSEEAGGRTRATDVRAPAARTADSRQAPASPQAGERRAAGDISPPSTSLPQEQPASTDATVRAKEVRAHASNDQGDPIGEALLEQSRLQTRALQQIAAQQQAADEVRQSEQQARTQRGLQVDSARGSITSTVNSLQTTGDWDADALQSTRLSLQQTAAAASAAGSPTEASRAADAARLIRAAQEALAERNSQQAQYYLLQANELLHGG